MSHPGLDLTFECRDLGKTVTVREYLKQLLLTLWREGEGFSGKRPFGNSGWEGDLAGPLVEAKLLRGRVHYYEEEGVRYVEDVDYDQKKYDALVVGMIEDLFAEPPN